MSCDIITEYIASELMKYAGMRAFVNKLLAKQRFYM